MHQLAELPGIAACLTLIVAATIACAWLRSSWPAWPVLGLVWTSYVASQQLATRLPPGDEGTDWRVTGWVDGVPAAGAGRVGFSLRVVAAEAVLAGARLRLSWYDPPARIEPGQLLSLTVRLRHPRGYANPHAFDYERWLFLEGYAATGYVRASHAAPLAHGSTAARLLRFRWELAERVRGVVADESAAAMMTALAIGERSGISDELWTVLRRTGTSHLIAISGLHISLLSGLCFVTVGALVRRAPVWIATWDLEIALTAALIVACGYAALAGFALPTRRAAIMVGLAALVVLSRRRVSALGGLSIALIVVLALDPLAPLSASFWLSFSAVAVLLVCALPRRVERDGSRRTLGRRMARGAALQCQLTLALAPLSAAFFGGVSVLAVPVNLLAIPAFCLGLIPLTLLAVLVLAVTPSLTLPSSLAANACALAIAALARVAELPAALIETQAAGPLVLGIAVAAVAIALPWHRAAGRRGAWFALLPLFFPRSAELPAGKIEVQLLDVGHGLAVVLTTRRHRMVYDAGPLFRSGFDAGAEILVPTLRNDRGRGVDLIVVSHADSDHSGGAPALLRAYPQAELLHGSDVELGAGRPCLAGQGWHWDGVDFEIVHPARGFPARGNEGSCVLLVRTATQSMLLTGDIERDGESALVRRGDLDVDVVVVPHHGSATSSSAALIASTSPDLALVSAAYANQWGFPVPEVRARWQRAGAELHVTGETGAIALRLGGTAPELRLERDRRQRYWRARRASVSGETSAGTL